MAESNFMAHKCCAKCNEQRAPDQFPVRGGRICKACVNQAQNERRAKRLGLQEKFALAQRNMAHMAQGQRECRVCSAVKSLNDFRLKNGKRSLRCNTCTNEAVRVAYASNINGIRDRSIEHGREHRKKHAQRRRDQERAYVANNRSRVTQRQNEWQKARLRTDPVFALKKRVRSLISNAFASVGCQKNQETQAILGCSWDDFRTHIERQFTAGMSWEQMGAQIHIDHIRPLALAVSEAEVLALNHFTNLRPMWAAENIAKGAKAVFLL